jgi:hypothetical protein
LPVKEMDNRDGKPKAVFRLIPRGGELPG